MVSKMSYWSSEVVPTNIKSNSDYYFLTEERINEGIFILKTPNVVVVSNPDRHVIPTSGKVLAVPKEVLKVLDPAKDFDIKIRIDRDRPNNFGAVPLGNLLTPELFGKQEFTYALLTAGEPSIDLGNGFEILSKNVYIPKFKDADIMKKLTNALNQAVFNFDRFKKCDFKVESKDGRTSLTVTVEVNEELKKRLGMKDVGKFDIPVPTAAPVALEAITTV